MPFFLRKLISLVGTAVAKGNAQVGEVRSAEVGCPGYLIYLIRYVDTV